MDGTGPKARGRPIRTPGPPSPPLLMPSPAKTKRRLTAAATAAAITTAAAAVAGLASEEAASAAGYGGGAAAAAAAVAASTAAAGPRHLARRGGGEGFRGRGRRGRGRAAPWRNEVCVWVQLCKRRQITPPWINSQSLITPQQEERQSRKERSWEDLFENCPKTFRSILESFLFRSNRASKIGPGGGRGCYIVSFLRQTRRAARLLFVAKPSGSRCSKRDTDPF